jgi:DNA primase
VIAFVQQLEQVSFRDAVVRLGADPFRPAAPRTGSQRPPDRGRTAASEPGAAERAVLNAAVELYANRLLADRAALAYLTGRGYSRELLVRERVGYAVGDELVRYLAWRHLPFEAARRTGLLRADGREHLAGRIVFPEMRQGDPVWLIGRVLGPCLADAKYLGLPGPKPLLGWDEASRDLRGVCIVEGPMDVLALRAWGVPGLALCGTRLSPQTLALLDRWARLYIVLDADQAGREATARLVDALRSRAIPVALPPGIKDPAELATRPDGAMLFSAVLHAAVAARMPGFVPASAQPLRGRFRRLVAGGIPTSQSNCQGPRPRNQWCTGPRKES